MPVDLLNNFGDTGSLLTDRHTQADTQACWNIAINSWQGLIIPTKRGSVVTVRMGRGK